MMLKMLLVAVDIVLVVGTFFISCPLWELRKRAKFLTNAMGNEPLIESLLVMWRKQLENPPAAVAIYSQHNEIGYFFNVTTAIRADERSQRMVGVFFSIFLLAIFVGSFLLGFVLVGVHSWRRALPIRQLIDFSYGGSRANFTFGPTKRWPTRLRSRYYPVQVES